MNNEDIKIYLQKLKNGEKIYTPLKYFSGLKTKSEIRSRFNEIKKKRYSSVNDNKNYKPFQTDIDQKTKRYKSTTKSKYTLAFEKHFGPNYKSLEAKAEITGIPYTILKKVYDKGRAAWRTGHRVGANENQWGYARVHSFITLGCTVFSADFYLFKEALKKMKLKDKKKLLNQKILCTSKNTLSKYSKNKEYILHEQQKYL